jgi:hypothetical protein
MPGHKKSIRTDMKRLLKEDVIETEIDDMNPQFCDFVKLQLYKKGAVEVQILPRIFKKERPGIMLRVVCPKTITEHIAKVIFEETTTFGLKVNNKHSFRLHIDMRRIKTKYGPVRIKIGSIDGKVFSASPEYEDAKVVAQKACVPIKEVFLETVCDYRKLCKKKK